jgi:hypothetical protein
MFKFYSFLFIYFRKLFLLFIFEKFIFFFRKTFKNPKIMPEKEKKSNVQPQEAFHRTPEMVLVAAADVGRRGRGWTQMTPTKGGRHRRI